MTRNSLLLDHQRFSKGQPNITLTGRDIAALKTLRSLGGRIAVPADLAAALEEGSVASQQNALIGGRLIRRLESLGFVREIASPGSGYEITAIGQQTAKQPN